MQIRFFTIPVQQAEERNEEINKFLRTHTIIEMEKSLQTSNNTLYWCFYIQYQERKDTYKNNTEKIDYKDQLPPDAFQRFLKLRQKRKEIAVEDAITNFSIVFTDAELADIAEMESPTINNIRSIKGIGDKKAERFGERILSALIQPNETAS